MLWYEDVWDVADEATCRLVPEFYRLRVGGRDKAEALRAAHLQLLRQSSMLERRRGREARYLFALSPET